MVFRALPSREDAFMRNPLPLPMELALCALLGIVVIVTIFAIREPPGDRTRFTLERSDTAAVVRERRAPLAAEETALGR